MHLERAFPGGNLCGSCDQQAKFAFQLSAIVSSPLRFRGWVLHPVAAQATCAADAALYAAKKSGRNALRLQAVRSPNIPQSAYISSLLARCIIGPHRLFRVVPPGVELGRIEVSHAALMEWQLRLLLGLRPLSRRSLSQSDLPGIRVFR